MWFLFVGLGALLLFIEKSDANGTTGVIDSITTGLEDTAETLSVDVGAPLNSWIQFDSLFQKYGDQFSVPWQWLKAFAMNESSLGKVASVANGIANPTDIEGSKSSDGKSWGLMQMTLSTARGIDANADAVQLNNPEYSINLSAQYIEQLMEMFNSTDPRFIEWVVKSYNQGPGNTHKEIAGTGGGYANAYWDRWQRNYQKVIGG